MEEETAFRRRRVGAGALLVAGAVLLWADGRNRAVASPDAALADLAAALRSGEPAALARARRRLQAATRHSPLSSSPMRRLAALDLALAWRPACDRARGSGRDQGSASGLSGDEQIACRLLAGDFTGARRSAGPEPRGRSQLLARLAEELNAAAGERPAPGPFAHGSSHAR